MSENNGIKFENKKTGVLAKQGGKTVGIIKNLPQSSLEFKKGHRFLVNIINTKGGRDVLKTGTGLSGKGKHSSKNKFFSNKTKAKNFIKLKGGGGGGIYDVTSPMKNRGISSKNFKKKLT